MTGAGGARTPGTGGGRLRLVDALANQSSEPAPAPLGAIAEAARRFVREEAGFAQVYTVNAAGFPAGRTMVAVLDDDWSVPLIQRNVHRRLSHLARRPQVEIVWVGTPAPGSRNDHPHVFDFGLLAPRVVFLRGIAAPMDPPTLWRRYREISERQLALGLAKAPARDESNVLAELAGFVVRPVQVRAEGFGDGPQSFTWTEEDWSR